MVDQMYPQKKKSECYLFLDIETIPSGDPMGIEVKAPKNYKDPEKIANYINEHRDEEFRKRSLDVLKCQPIVISAAINDSEIQTFSGSDEAMLMAEFAVYVKWASKHYERIILVAQNGDDFDLPILYNRFIKYGFISEADIFSSKGYGNSNSVDTRTLPLGGWAHKSKIWISLKDVCEFAGIPSPKDDIDGSQVYDCYLKGELPRIAAYCAKDVDRTRRVFEFYMKGKYQYL